MLSLANTFVPADAYLTAEFVFPLTLTNQTFLRQAFVNAAAFTQAILYMITRDAPGVASGGQQLIRETVALC